MGKFTVMFLTEVLVVLPIVFGIRFHGHDSYKQYYDVRVNGGRKYSTSTSYEMPKKTHDNPDEDNNVRASKNNFGSSDMWQVRNGDDNYAVTPCNHMGQTFCEDDPNYPRDFVNQILAKNSTLLHYAQEDVIAVEPRLDNEEEPLCLSTELLIRPKMAENQRNEWLYILQSDEPIFHQSIRIEICKEQDSKCKIIDDFAEGYVTMCKQKYIYRELSAISKGEVVRDYFRLPSSCCCHIQFKGDDDDENNIGESKAARVRSLPEDIFRPQIM